MKTNPIPDGYHTITPFLIVDGAAKLISFLQYAFNAEIKARVLSPEGLVRNAEMKVGSSMLLISDVRPGLAASPAKLYLYVADVDEAYSRAIEAGGQSIAEPTTHFHGDRSGAVTDGLGNQWWIATRLENLSADELNARAAALKK